MTAVLAHVLSQTTYGVHKPQPGFVPPPPETMADVAGLTALCGTPLSGVAGYGELEVLQLGQALGQCHLLWCRMCWPMGAP